MRICQGSRVEKISSHFQFNQKKTTVHSLQTTEWLFPLFLTNQKRAQVASSMKIVLYEVVTWTWQKYFGSISLSLHTKKADQRAMSDSRVQREITLFQMTFEWKRASRVVAVVPVSSFIDFCPEIQDGRVGWTTNSTKTKQIFGLRSRVREVFPRDKRGCHRGTDGGRQPTPACCLNWK